MSSGPNLSLDTSTQNHPLASPLPDPLVKADGTKVTSARQWQNERRPEILQLFAENIYGKTPLGRPDYLRFTVREENKHARGGRATRLRIGILFEGHELGRQMELLLYLPTRANGPVPLFLGLNFNGNFATTDETDLPLPSHYVQGLGITPNNHRATESMRGHDKSMWPYDAILDRGYGIATACYCEAEPDLPNQWWHGPRVLAPPSKDDDWGSIGAWAWSLSRAMDYLETNPRVDANRVAVFGFSRLGKTAMWAGAQDQRFAAVISQNSGKGGASLYRHPHGEPLAHLAGKDLGHWFAPNYRRYVDNESALPVDAHELAALIAPRGLLILSAADDHWSDPQGEFLSAVAATPVYNLLGADSLSTENFPPPPTLFNSTLGYFIRPGGHNVTRDDWHATLDWSDRHVNS